ncbi:MAG: electron transfer flavoprotein subunit beta/FixA family protein [Actinobacteria bacterium]|nr:electron transfer flavoprotein subunit beta/FixA family protein [Actinomycetota bacterium]
MNVVVLSKFVPNPEGVPEMGDDFLLKREGVEGALDPGDEFGVEAGLQLAEASGGEVTVVSMGPEAGATTAIRKALSMGAAKAVLISDAQLKGSDALVTARVLAAAIQKSGFDVVIAGVESTDGYTGTLPMTLAELLGVPSLTFAKSIENRDGTLVVQRQTETGYDVVECPAPAVITVTAGANSPRYPTLKGIMQAKQKPVEQLDVAGLGLSGDDVQPAQKVEAVEPAPEKAAGEVIEDDGTAAKRIADILAEAKVI